MAMLRQVPQIKYDAWSEFGNDLQLSGTSDLRLVSGSDFSEQRVIRRLFTNPVDYCWHPTYGAGLPAYVGQALSTSVYDQIQSTITSQIFLESSVAQNPAPQMTFQTIQNGLYVQINYTMAVTQQPIVITFPVSAV